MSELLPAPYEVLASDPEREAVAEALRAHATAGRIDPEELEQRLGLAYAARRRADLLPLLADLPAPAAPRPRESRRMPSVPVIPLVMVLLVVIWAATGAGYFWPMWPIGAMVLTGIKHRGYGRMRRPRRLLDWR